jgi:hypothetical protein
MKEFGLILGDEAAQKAFGDKALEEFKSNRFRFSFCVYPSPFPGVLMEG